MGFHLINTTITFEWIIQPNAAPLVKADFDVALTLPSGVSTYTDDGVLTYVAPTATTQGKITYELTPICVGRHQATLSDGTNLAHIVQAYREIYVVDVPGYVLNGTPAKLTRGPEICPDPYITNFPINSSNDLWAENYAIYGLGYDGGDLVVFSARQNTPIFDNIGLYTTTPELDEPVFIKEANTLPGWQGGNSLLGQFAYSPTLDIWVISSYYGDAWWTEDLVNFTYIPLATGIAGHTDWNGLTDAPMGVWWNPGLQLFYRASRAVQARALMVSSDGKTWVSQDSLEVWLPGDAGEQIYTNKRFEVNGVTINWQSVLEQYRYKMVDTGGSTGWTEVTANQILGGAGTRGLNHTATDGSSVVVAAQGYMNAAGDITDFSAAWGPDTFTNLGWSYTDMGMASNTGNVYILMYLPEFARPWIMYRDQAGWYDAASITPGIAPQFARPTVEPWLGLQALWDITTLNHPAFDPGNYNRANYYHEQSPDDVWGQSGWAFIMQKDSSRLDDYILFQRTPSMGAIP